MSMSSHPFSLFSFSLTFVEWRSWRVDCRKSCFGLVIVWQYMQYFWALIMEIGLQTWNWFRIYFQKSNFVVVNLIRITLKFYFQYGYFTSTTDCFRELDLTLVKEARWLFSSHFWYFWSKLYFWMVAGEKANIGLCQKSNQVKHVQRYDTSTSLKKLIQRKSRLWFSN